jgi:hypothetical protein
VRALAPKPYRGDVIAAGVVVLTAGVVLAALRLDADGALLAVAAPAAGVVLAMAVLSAPGEAARPYVTILAVGGWILALLALAGLARVLGAADLRGAGTIAWLAAAVASLAGALAVGKGLPALSALGAVSATVGVAAAVIWALDPGDRPGATRWVLLVATLGFGVAAVGWRDHRRRHAVALADAAGIALLGIAATLGVLAPLGVRADVLDPSPGAASWGWEALLLLAAWGLIAYAAVDRERVPGFIGVLALAGFALVAARGDTGLPGWPLLLLVLGAGVLAFGLRPAREVPPEPGSDAPPAPPLSIDSPR